MPRTQPQVDIVDAATKPAANPSELAIVFARVGQCPIDHSGIGAGTSRCLGGAGGIQRDPKPGRICGAGLAARRHYRACRRRGSAVRTFVAPAGYFHRRGQSKSSQRRCGGGACRAVPELKLDGRRRSAKSRVERRGQFPEERRGTLFESRCPPGANSSLLPDKHRAQDAAEHDSETQELVAGYRTPSSPAKVDVWKNPRQRDWPTLDGARRRNRNKTSNKAKRLSGTRKRYLKASSDFLAWCWKAQKVLWPFRENQLAPQYKLARLQALLT